MKQIRTRITYANVMSSLAVFLVLGGATAFAASKIGSNQLKANAVTSGKIKKNAVTTNKLKNKAVTSAKIGNGAVSNDQTALLKVFKGGNIDAAVDQASAPRLELGTVGPFHFYAKCFHNGANVQERTYIELSSGSATMSTEDSDDFGGNTTGYLLPSSPEDTREVENDASAGANAFDAEADDEEFSAAASDGTRISGIIGGGGAKQGIPPAGNGPFNSGDSCIVGTVGLFGS